MNQLRMDDFVAAHLVLVHMIISDHDDLRQPRTDFSCHVRIMQLTT